MVIKGKQAGQILMKNKEIGIKSLLSTTIFLYLVAFAIPWLATAEVKQTGKSPSKLSGDIDVELHVEN
jgi:hypothetical protein